MLARAGWALPIALMLFGCVDAVDDGSRHVGQDAVQVPTPTEADSAPPGDPSEWESALRAALERLVRGDAQGPAEQTWFSAATAGALRNATVDSVGHARVNFEDLRALIPNASSSAGSKMLLDELNATVFSLEGVRSVDYAIEGRCDLFWEWLQRDCQTVYRPG